MDLVQTQCSPYTAAVSDIQSVCFAESKGHDYVCWYKLIPKESKVTTVEEQVHRVVRAIQKSPTGDGWPLTSGEK